jgi:hypothetical protein
MKVDMYVTSFVYTTKYIYKLLGMLNVFGKRAPVWNFADILF